MTKTSTYFDLRDACQLPGCPICRIEQKAVQRCLDAIMYEQVNDPGTREHLRGSLGFCREHAWQVASKMLGNALGLAIIYNDVLDEALKRLDEHPAQSKISLSSHQTCPACEQRDVSTQRTLSEMLKYIDDEGLIAAMQNSDGLCLPHLGLVLQETREPRIREVLLEMQREKIRHLRSELAEFIRKNDYRFMHEGFAAERNSWRRAIGMTVGDSIENY